MPDSVVVEQASGSTAARYVASLIEKGEVLADLTAGLGVNTFFFSRRAKLVYSIEKDKNRAKALQHNLKIAGVENVKVAEGDCIEWLKDNPQIEFDTVYVDPSRRSTSGRRILLLEDCSPDISKVIEQIHGRSKRMLVKASPLLDITSVTKEFPSIKEVYIIEVRREVKELLLDFKLSGDGTGKKLIHCVLLNESTPSHVITFPLKEIEKEIDDKFLKGRSEISEGQYLYEPSPAVMKSGKFNAVLDMYPELKKLGRNTHLFTSGRLVKEFPGRKFQIEGFVSSKDLKKMKGESRSVISRNHPATAAELERRFKFRSSEREYLIACQVGKDKTIMSVIKLDN